MWVQLQFCEEPVDCLHNSREPKSLRRKDDAKRHLQCRFTNQQSVCETKKRRRDGMYEFCCKQQNEGYAIRVASRSSYKERKGNALASGADEGRDKLR